MATTNISLPDTMKRFVESQVESGEFANTSDYIRDLIRRDEREHALVLAALRHRKRVAGASSRSTTCSTSCWNRRLRIELTADANADLRSIPTYTVRVHGAVQARRYLAELRARMRAVAANPRMGRVHRGAASGTCRAPCGQHFIYYRLEGDTLLVVRVLHQRIRQEGRLT